MTASKLTIAITLSGILFFGVVAWMSTLRQQLVIPGKTNALYSLETARTKKRVTEIINYWKVSGKKDIAWKFNTIDLLLIAGYTPFFFFGIRRLVQLFPEYDKAAAFLMRLSIVAGLLDAIEGIIIYIWLSGAIDSVTPFIISITSFSKFLIAIPLFFLILVGFLTALIQKRFH